MTVLTVITLASGLVLAPAHAANTPCEARCQQAHRTLDRLTSNAQAELRKRAVDRALSEGLVSFREEFARRMAAHAREQVASNRGSSTAAPRTAN